VTLLLPNRELVSRVKLGLVSIFPDIVTDCPEIRKIPKIFLRSFENVAPGSILLHPPLPHLPSLLMFPPTATCAMTRLNTIVWHT